MTNWQSNIIFFIEPAPLVTARISPVVTTGSVPHHLAISPDGKEVWISNHHSDDVTVIAALARRELTRIAVGKRPHHVVVASDGRRAYVANSDSNDVSIIDAIRKKVIGRVLVGSNPHGIAAR